MSNLTAERDELKSLLRGLLISSPVAMTAVQLQKDYRAQEGREVPFRLLGYSSFLEYLRSIPDTVKLHNAPGGGSPVVIPVQSQKSSHVDALVQKQRLSTSKRPSRRTDSLPRRRSVRSPIEPSYSSFSNSNWCSRSQNSFPLRQNVFVPNNLQQRIYSMLQENPKGISIQTIQREFFPFGMHLNYGINGIEELLTSLGHILKVHNGMIYPVECRLNNVRQISPSFFPPGYEDTGSFAFRPVTPYRYHSDNVKRVSPSFVPSNYEHKASSAFRPVTSVKYQSDSLKQMSSSFVPSSYEDKSGFAFRPVTSVKCESDNLKQISSSFVPSSYEDKASFAFRPVTSVKCESDNLKQVSSSFVPSGHEDKGGFESGSLNYKVDVCGELLSESEEYNDEIQDNIKCYGDDVDTALNNTKQDAATPVSDRETTDEVSAPSPAASAHSSESCALVSDKMRSNFRLLLDEHPYGILCSELPQIYKGKFGGDLDFRCLGFMSIVQMASELPDIFHCIRLNGSDWKLLDARSELPSKYNTRSIRAEIRDSAFLLPKVPPRIHSNIEKLVAFHPSGLSNEQFLMKYMEFFHYPLNLEEMGFDTVESLLLFLNNTALHVRYVDKKILVYPRAKDCEIEPDNPLPHLTEVTLSEDNLEVPVIEDAYPPEVVGPKETLMYQKIPPETTEGSFLEVLVAEIYTPRKFWLQLRGEKTTIALDKLMNEIQQFYIDEAPEQYYMPDVTIRIGQYCMALYNSEWHRARIMSFQNIQDVQVVFIDYGTVSKIKRRELRFMHHDFAELPMQAIEASLANLKPCGGLKKWPRSTSQRFLELVTDKTLIAVVSSVDYEARKLEIGLVDTTGIEDVHINDLLKQEGLAEFEKIQEDFTTSNRNVLPKEEVLAECETINRLDSPKREDDRVSPQIFSRPPPPPGFNVEYYKQKQSDRQSASPLGFSQVDYGTPANFEVFGTPYSQQNFPTANIRQPVPIPQSQNMTLPPTFPVMNSNPLLMPQNQLAMAFYDHYFNQPFLNSVVPNSSLAAITNSILSNHITNQVSAAAAAAAAAAVTLVNPFGVPMVNLPMMYPVTPFSERNEYSRPEMNISEVPSENSPTARRRDSSSVNNNCTIAGRSSVEDRCTSSAFNVKRENIDCETWQENASHIVPKPLVPSNVNTSAKVGAKNSQTTASNKVMDVPNSAISQSRDTDQRGILNRQTEGEIKIVNSGMLRNSARSSVEDLSTSSACNVKYENMDCETRQESTSLVVPSNVNTSAKVGVKNSQMTAMDIPNSAFSHTKNTDQRGLMSRQTEGEIKIVNSGILRNPSLNTENTSTNITEKSVVSETSTRLNNLNLNIQKTVHEENFRCTPPSEIPSSASPDTCTESDEIYQSEDESDGQEARTNRLRYIKKVELAKRLVHLINLSGTPYLSTDELVRLFTHFSGRHVILKILDSRGIALPFIEISRNGALDLIQEVERCEVQGISKSGAGHIVGKLHLVPLTAVPQLLTLFNLIDIDVFAAIQATLEQFPRDEYWTADCIK